MAAKIENHCRDFFEKAKGYSVKTGRYSISKSTMIPRRQGGGDEAWFDKLTMTEYQF